MKRKKEGYLLKMEIKINHLLKCFNGINVLDHVSFTINNGVFGLLGENGAGKTTMLEIIATLTSFDEGEIEIAGFDVKKDQQEIRRILGFLPQKFDFFPNVTVEDMLDYLCKLKGIDSKANRIKEIDLRLQEVGLQNQRKKQIKELSGGMKQRLGIAQALLGDPKILLIDEPTVGLDPHERLSFRNLISSISKDKIILLSTHIVQDIESTCKNLMILRKGKIHFIGSTEELIKKVEGKVWVMSTTGNYENIIQSTLLVSINDRGSSIQIRYIADQPLALSKSVEPTLEDAYIYVNRKELSI